MYLTEFYTAMKKNKVMASTGDHYVKQSKADLKRKMPHFLVIVDSGLFVYSMLMCVCAAQ